MATGKSTHRECRCLQQLILSLVCGPQWISDWRAVLWSPLPATAALLTNLPRPGRPGPPLHPVVALWLPFIYPSVSLKTDAQEAGSSGGHIFTWCEEQACGCYGVGMRCPQKLSVRQCKKVLRKGDWVVGIFTQSVNESPDGTN